MRWVKYLLYMCVYWSLDPPNQVETGQVHWLPEVSALREQRQDPQGKLASRLTEPGGSGFTERLQLNTAEHDEDIQCLFHMHAYTQHTLTHTHTQIRASKIFYLSISK